MICSNCGFRNEPGDEFCGSCGTFLGFTAAEGGEGQPTDQGGAVDQPTGSGAGADSPTTVQPVVPSGPGGATGATGATPAAGATGAAGSGWSGPPPEVICWNCGRRNPGGRAFCMQCGTKLTTEGQPMAGAGAAGAAAGAGAGGAGVTYGRPGGGDSGDGGGDRRALALGIAFLALLLLAGAATAAFLGVFSGPPAGTPVALGPSPSASPSASGLVSMSPGFGSPAPSFVFPTTLPTIEVITFPPPTEPPPTPRPTKTPRPTCDATGAPHGCRPSPQPSPTDTPSPTPEPTPANCLSSTAPTKSATLTTEFPTRTIPADSVWCVHDITFTNTSLPGATGTLKLYLENPEFIGPPGNYGMAKIGWAEASIENDFTSSSEYHPPIVYPFPYEALPGETIVSFEIVNCGTNGTCGGTVTIEFERVLAP